MTKIMAAIAAFLALVALAHPAEARARHNTVTHVSECRSDNNGRTVCGQSIAIRKIERVATRSYRHDANGNDPRPHAWCGWQMRQWLGVADRAGNLARWWARFGSPSRGPQVGAIVVWPHHVGLITGKSAEGWIVKSGNDGHAVRERERSLRGAIAFRLPA